MAWRSTGRTNTDLIGNLFRNGLITSPIVRDAMLKVDRAHYCPDQSRAYADSPQDIGHGATISAPHMHALAVEALLISFEKRLLGAVTGTATSGTSTSTSISSSSFTSAGASQSTSPSTETSPSTSTGIAKYPPLRILDIGSGSGYLTHVLAELLPNDGKVIGVEHIPALRDLGERNMRRSVRGVDMLAKRKVGFVVGDGRRGWVDDGGDYKREDGQEEEGASGWDAIHVGAAAKEIHEDLIRQLRRPGRLFIPVQEKHGNKQHIYIVDKDENGNVVKKKQYGVSYVPLTDAPSA